MPPVTKKSVPATKSGKTNPNSMVGKGALNELPNVTVTAKRPSKTPMVMPKAKVDSSGISKVKAPVSNTKAPEGKKMGRAMTALSDASSLYRGAANLAFGKNQSKTTGGKILERVARVGAAATGIGTQPAGAAASYASKIAANTNKATGYIKKGTQAAAGSAARSTAAAIGAGTALLPAIAGQIGFNKRSEESKKRGLLNPGKGNANISINFDKVFQKKSAASDTTSKAKTPVATKKK